MINTKRIVVLIRESLKGINHPDWEINNGKFRSNNDTEPYGIEFHHDKAYVYAKERGARNDIAIFNSPHLAAEYFVWIVSDGKRSIDWSLPTESLD